jgi:hypothetical protein
MVGKNQFHPKIFGSRRMGIKSVGYRHATEKQRMCIMPQIFKLLKIQSLRNEKE